MNKLCRIHVIIVLAASVSMSLFPMELITSLLPDISKKSYKPGLDNRDVVLFAADFSFVPVEKSHLPLIKALYPEYIKHNTLADSGRVIPSFSHVSTSGLQLVNAALKVRPDKFTEYYVNLMKEDHNDPVLLKYEELIKSDQLKVAEYIGSAEENYNDATCHGRYLALVEQCRQNIAKNIERRDQKSRVRNLIKASGRYDENGSKTMLDVPEITKRLIDVYFPKDLAARIKHYFSDEEADEVRAYFKEQLITKKGLFSFKESMEAKHSLERIRDDIYLGSCFIDAGNTINQFDYPINLKTQDEVRKTYAVHFGVNNYEYRITDVRGNNCFLWIVNHDNPEKTCATHIQLKNPIKGCKISNTQKDVEYALIYSKKDIVLAEMHTKDGLEFVNPIRVAMPENSTIVDVCYEPIKNTWLVGLYEGHKSVIKVLQKDGTFAAGRTVFAFKNYGLMEKMALYQALSTYYLSIIFGVAGLTKTVEYRSNDIGAYNRYGETPLSNVGTNGNYGGSTRIIKIGKSMHVFDDKAPFFVKNAQAQCNNHVVNAPQEKSMYDIVSSGVSAYFVQPETEVHQVYSPNGEFLMCNSLKNKAGVLHVETVIKNAATHRQIFSFDTAYFNFVGVGFTPDSKDLIVVRLPGRHDKISLITDEDQEMLAELEKVAFANCGVTSLLKRLCLECKEKNIVALKKDSSTRAMLMEWAKSSKVMQKLLMKCLPIDIK